MQVWLLSQVLLLRKGCSHYLEIQRMEMFQKSKTFQPNLTKRGKRGKLSTLSFGVFSFCWGENVFDWLVKITKWPLWRMLHIGCCVCQQKSFSRFSSACFCNSCQVLNYTHSWKANHNTQILRLQGLCKMAVFHFSHLRLLYHCLSGRTSSTEVWTRDVTAWEMAAETEKWQPREVSL